LPVFSYLMARLAKGRFIVTESLEKDFIIKGQEVKYYFEVKNNSFLPCTSVKVSFDKSSFALESDFEDIFFSIMPFKVYQVIFKVGSKYRGVFPLGVKSIVLYDFLGLFSFEQIHTKSLDLVVSPKVVNMAPLPLVPANQGIETRDTSRQEDYFIVSDLRKYQPGDGYKKIHWKMSAKKRELISKNFQGIKKNSARIIVNNSVTKMSPLERLILEDKIMESAVSILNQVTARGYTVGFSCMGSEAEGTFDYLYQIASKTEFFEIRERETFDKYLVNFSKMQVDTDNLIILMQSIKSNVLETILSIASLGNNVVVVYFDDSEITRENKNLHYLKMNEANY